MFFDSGKSKTSRFCACTLVPYAIAPIPIQKKTVNSYGNLPQRHKGTQSTKTGMIRSGESHIDVTYGYY